MTINEWTKIIHENAVKHGWWDNKRNFSEVVALCHSELSEALEEERAGHPPLWFGCTESTEGTAICSPQDETECMMCDKEKLCKYADNKPEGKYIEMIDCVIRILDYLGSENVDVEKLLKMKHEYNTTRPYKHGKVF